MKRSIAIPSLVLVLLVPQLMFGLEAPKYNADKAAIGKRLFFDTRLSGDTTLSCASCHNPDKGFADGTPLSRAYSLEGIRNTPTLINTALKKKNNIPWFHDGRMGTNLNDVARDQITETAVMNMDMRLMQERVKQDPVYVRMFKEAGLGEPSNGKVRSALQEYMKTLVSQDVPYDSGTMSESAKRGQQVFNGAGNCLSCHTGELFSDGKAYRTGVPENAEIFSNPARYAHFLAFTSFMGVENYANLKRDPGAFVQTHDQKDMGTFITPTLRELKYTAPYMHNGAFASLEEVIEFYDKGGDARTDGNTLQPLGLTQQQKSDLEAFLLSLSGRPLTDDAFVYRGEYTYELIEDWLQTPN